MLAEAAEHGRRAAELEEDAAHLRRLPRDAQGEGPRHRPGRHARPLARPADDRRRARPGPTSTCRSRSAWTWSKGRRCSPPPASTSRVVQVGTQRRSTPHLIEARDRDHRGGQARQDRPRRDLLLLPHAGQRQPAGHRRRRSTSTTRCGPARPRCGRTTSSSTRGGGGRSWSTATASSATCASTCSTWSAGCSTSAGRSGSARPAASSCEKASKSNITDTQTATFDFGDFDGRLAAPHLGHAARPEVSLGRDVLRRQGHAQGERDQLRLHPAAAGGKPIHKDVTLRAGASTPRTRPRRTWSCTSPRRSAGTCRTSWPRSQTRGKPVADIEQGYISTAACILANLSMQLGPVAAVGPGARRDGRRRRGQQAAAPALPRAVGPSRNPAKV